MSRGRFDTTIWSMVDEARTGDRQALEEMLQQYRPGLVSFALLKGLTPAEAEDVAQETLIRLVDKMSAVDPERGKFRSLVQAIAHNAVREQLRRRRPAQALPVEELPAPEEENLAFDRAWIWNLVMGAMEQLRQECERRGTHFHTAMNAQLDGKSHRQIAEALGADEKQVKGFVRHARAKLRRRIKGSIAEYALSDEFEAERAYLLRLVDL